jgi:hypothetical protein
MRQDNLRSRRVDANLSLPSIWALTHSLLASGHAAVLQQSRTIDDLADLLIFHEVSAPDWLLPSAWVQCIIP